jgi:hypothetical protein
VGSFAFVLTVSALAAQQPSVIISNPRAIEFEIPAKDQSDVVWYRLEVFANGSDIALGQPLGIIDFQVMPVRIELGTALDGLDGSYFATLRVVGRGGESARSAPTSALEVTSLRLALGNRPSTNFVAAPLVVYTRQSTFPNGLLVP